MKTTPSPPVMDRTQGLGGYDIGALFGVHPWMSVPQLYLEKTGQLFARPDTEPKYWGRAFEDCIARRFGLTTDRRVQKINRAIVSPDYTFLRGHPDRFQWDRRRGKTKQRGVLEVKTTNFANLRSWSSDGIPASYYLQLQFYLWLTRTTWGSFAVLFGGQKLVHFDVERDDKVIDVIVDRARAFWRLVETRTPPPITLSSEWNEHIAAFFPQPHKGQEISLASQEDLWRAKRLLSLRTAIHRREEEIDQHEVYFKKAIGHAERAVVPGLAALRWTASETTRLDLDALRRERPEIAKQFEKVTKTRRFSVRALCELDED